MQRKQITTGELLAYREGSYGPYAPAIVLDTSTLWMKTRNPGNPTVWKPTEDKRPGRASASYTRVTSTWGYLTVLAKASHDTSERDKRAEAVTTWLAMVEDPHHLTPETVAALAASMPSGLELKIIDSRRLVGPWAPTVAVFDRHEAAEAEEKARTVAERERRAALYRKCAPAWRERFGDEHGMDYDRYDDTVRMPLAALAALLGVDTES